ncbi:hypothetical protein GOP47_0002126 [Adiantum capillus-veneris]|uniref:Uncharacterized protein n=1 Tax=Adiantum capillus-veneris TaxID=13818 RepID=A0A9D4VB44_ADICA|nr:hypothetical protein GOP47_0002126 [Adiantum capillus-veneris]
MASNRNIYKEIHMFRHLEDALLDVSSTRTTFTVQIMQRMLSQKQLHAKIMAASNEAGTKLALDMEPMQKRQRAEGTQVSSNMLV